MTLLTRVVRNILQNKLKTKPLLQQYDYPRISAEHFYDVSFLQLWRMQNCFTQLANAGHPFKALKFQPYQSRGYQLSCQLMAAGQFSWRAEEELLLYYSSPIQGVFRYYFNNGQWWDVKDGHLMKEHVTRELMKVSNCLAEW